MNKKNRQKEKRKKEKKSNTLVLAAVVELGQIEDESE